MPAACALVSDLWDGGFLLLQNVDGVKEKRKKPKSEIDSANTEEKVLLFS